MVEILELKCHKRALEICQKADDYFQLVGGKSVTLASVEEIFTAVPPTKTLEDKLVLGVYECGALIGLIDVIKDYPKKATWWIGLFLIANDRRNKGVGSVTHQKLVHYMKDNGANFIHLGVVEKNFKALKFWTHLGYQVQDIKTVEPDSIVVMELVIK